MGQIEERRREVEKNKSREEVRPHKQYMQTFVNWVAVVCAIEGEVLLKIKQSHLPQYWVLAWASKMTIFQGNKRKEKRGRWGHVLEEQNFSRIY